MSDLSILLLFAPQFNHFGCDVGREFLHRTGGGKIHGLCTGPIEIMDNVQKNLGSDGETFWHLHTEEKKWLKMDVSDDRFARVDDLLGPGAMGRIIVADRRVGRGFVRGGLCRPDDIGAKAVQSSDTMPQKYILGLFEFVERMLEETKPDVVFCYAVAGAPALMIAELCKIKNIPFTRFSTIRLKNRMLIDSDIAGRLACVRQTYRIAIKDPAVVQNWREEARFILNEFRKKPVPPGYMQRNYALLKTKKPWPETVKALKVTKSNFKGSGKKQNRMERIARLWFQVWILWRRDLVSLKSFADSPPQNSPFIYYPLHVDPEASTMVLSPWHTDQIGVIEALAKSAPAGMTVVVKEHFPMLGRRPKGFYKTISRIPRVVLLGPEHTGLSLIQKAKLTAVITGTAAWEAILLGKPALIIGDSPFLAIGQGAVHEPCLARLHQAIHKALAMPPAQDEALELYLAACLYESFDMDTSLLWGIYKDHPEEERRRAVDNIVTGIMKRVDECVSDS